MTRPDATPALVRAQLIDTLRLDLIGPRPDHRTPRRPSLPLAATLTLAACQTRRVELALGTLDPVGGEVLPVMPVRPDRAEALRDMAHYEGYRQYGTIPVLFYRDAGVIWPTAINPQTAPRIMAVYERAMDAARADERATRDTFVDVAGSARR